jgi:S1-C subfamily serine protease
MEGNFSGVYVAEANVAGAAYKAGVRDGDILVAINGKKMKNPSEVQAAINGFKPGDVVELLVYRDNRETVLSATLQGAENAMALADGGKVQFMGATLADAESETLRKLGLRAGVEVKELENGKFKDAGISKGLIITHINQTPVANVKEAVELMKNARRGFLVEGVYTNGKVYYYGVGV